MSSVMRWEPFREMLGLEGRLHQLMGGVVDTDAYGAWAPPVDIYERGDDLVIRAEVPGVSSDQVDVRVENGTLVLRGERKREEEVTDDKTYRLERTFGAFNRSFRIPTSVDAGKITARHSNGVLEIVLPMADQARPRRVEIQAN